MLNRELNLLGRLHIADDVYKLYNTQLQNQDLNFSYDIIYGLPNQTLTDIQYTLEELLKISPKHFSVYCLSLENNVPLYKDFSDIPEDALVEEMYFYIRKTLLEYGYNHYELSSFSLSNFESQHNTAYWSDKYYLGLGAGSSGYLPNIRYSNIADLEKYLSSSIETIQTITELSKQDNETDYIITGLRKCKGIIMKEVNDKFNINFLDKYAQQVDKLYKQKLIIIDGDHIRINPESYFISNEVLCEFV